MSDRKRRHLMVLLDPLPYRTHACPARAWRGRVEVFWAGRWETWTPPKTPAQWVRIAAVEMIETWRAEGKPWPPPWDDVRAFASDVNRAT